MSTDYGEIPPQLQAKFDQVMRTAEGIRDQLEDRAPSKAHLIGSVGDRDAFTSVDHGPYFFSSLALARSRDHSEQQQGKAQLDELGSRYAEPTAAKATLGTTEAGGGYLIPNNVVVSLVEQAADSRGSGGVGDPGLPPVPAAVASAHQIGILG